MLKRFLIVIFFFLIIFSSLADEQKIVYLNVDKIMQESIAGKSIKNQLEKIYNKDLEKFKKNDEILKKKEKKIIAQKKVISSEEYKKQVENLRSKVKALQKQRNNLIETVAKQRSKARNELLKNLNPIIKDYMKEKKIRMVVDKKSLLLADENLNITDDIINLLNKKIKSIKLN